MNLNFKVLKVLVPVPGNKSQKPGIGMAISFHEKFPRPHKYTETSHVCEIHPSCALNKFAQTKSGRVQLLNHNGPSTSNSEGSVSK